MEEEMKARKEWEENFYKEEGNKYKCLAKIHMVCIMSEKLLACRRPSPAYSVFLEEQFIHWQLSRIACGLPHELKDESEFMAAYSLSSPKQKNILCEFYLCNFMLEKNTGFMINLYVGESQLNAFVSVLQNQIAWKERESKFLLKASSTGLCMRAHYGKPSAFLTHFRTHAFDERFNTHYLAILQKSIDAFTSYEEENFEDIYEGCSKRNSYKWKSFRGEREFGYWNSDSESIGEAKFRSRSPFEDDEFDDSNPWWSEEEYDRDEYDDYDDDSQLKWGSTAVQEALRSWIWILPAVLIPWLVGNPMAVIMALFFPLAQTAVGSLLRRAWKAILRTFAPAPPKAKGKRKTTSYRNGWNQSDTMYSDSEQFTTYDEPELDASGSAPQETSQKYSWADPEKSRSTGVQAGSNLGGWEDLDNGTA
ncbi:hypothetical protein KI387_035320, partial [Taxus chinensis]